VSPRRLRLFATAVTAVSLSISAPAAARGEPEVAAHEENAEHGQGEEEHEQEFNWSYGFLGEKEGVEPSLAYRPKGMPAPFLANLLNAALLFTIIVTFGKKPIAEGLKKRKERIVQGMEEAGKMKADAAVSLAEYEKKLEHLDAEIERIKREMQEAAQLERHRILAEAKERRDRMERDARLLVEQELKAAREALVRDTVASAMRSAEDLIAKELGAADHDRLAKEYLETLKKPGALAQGGRS
jgi:F-type H+-transporting ATPase subunit b